MLRRFASTRAGPAAVLGRRLAACIVELGGSTEAEAAELARAAMEGGPLEVDGAVRRLGHIPNPNPNPNPNPPG